ncbi:MAG: helix-turn-helix transcriptional regulator [Planctomycetota bacterium]|jgi:predicted DNA-binding transcriptional regulator YafY|nr:WYL domain-containing protein [Blastopirellula sp.]
MARNEQLIRQHKILQILERVRFGKTLEEIRDDLIDELGIPSLHTRTIKRDLQALQAAGIDVDDHDTQRGKVWKLGPQYKQTHKINASATELIALSLGRQLLFPLAGTPFWMGIESFWNKIREELPAPVLEHYEKYSRTLRVMGLPVKNYEKQHGIIKTLNRAILEHRVVDVVYHSLGKPPAQRELEPYAIVLFQSSLYIIAAAAEDANPDSRVRSWKLDRFEKADVLDKYFKIPADLDLEKFIGHSLGMFVSNHPRDFKIRIAAHAARWVQEDPWHPEQIVKPLKDGGIELTVKAAHDLDIIPRVLNLGADAEILSPSSARQHMAEIVRKMAEIYRA